LSTSDAAAKSKGAGSPPGGAAMGDKKPSRQQLLQALDMPLADNLAADESLDGQASPGAARSPTIVVLRFHQPAGPPPAKPAAAKLAPAKAAN
jgi:hypothetical protein